MYSSMSKMITSHFEPYDGRFSSKFGGYGSKYSNDEVRNYLNSLDTFISGVKPNYTQHFELNRNKNEEKEIEKKEITPDLHLEYLKKKYCHPFSRIGEKIGEILCFNCQRFVKSEQIDEHSKICFNQNDIDIMIDDYNERLESLLLTLRIIENEFGEEAKIFEEICVEILENIIDNNNDFRKINENIDDFRDFCLCLESLRKSSLFKNITKRIVALSIRKAEKIHELILLPKNLENINFTPIKGNPEGISSQIQGHGNFLSPYEESPPLHEESKLSQAQPFFGNQSELFPPRYEDQSMSNQKENEKKI